MRPFLITGCGRSGTAWAAQLFTELGHPCGHERVFSLRAAGPLAAADSSWLAVPHLTRLPQGTPIVRVMRDPYRVVQSVMQRGFLRQTSGPYEAYVTRNAPEITQAHDHLGRAIRWASLWDEPVTDHPHRLLRIDTEEHDLAAVTSAVMYATGRKPATTRLRAALDDIGRKVNAGSGTPLPTREQIDRHPDGHLVLQRATLYGYED